MITYNPRGTARLFWNKTNPVQLGILINELYGPNIEPKENAYLRGMETFGLPREFVGVHTFDLTKDADCATVEKVIKAIEDGGNQYVAFVRTMTKDPDPNNLGAIEYVGFYLSDEKPDPKYATFNPATLVWDLPENIVDLRFADAQEAKIQEIKDVRYGKESSGITINGARIRTDRESQGMIAGAAMSAMLDPSYTCNWETDDGAVSLNAEVILIIAKAVRAHVQSAFDWASSLLKRAREAKTIEQIQAIHWNTPLEVK